MKSLLMSLVLAAAFQANAATVELGKYRAVDADTKSIIADFQLRANGTVHFTVKSPDFTMPAPGCEGKYSVKGNTFTANVNCPTPLLPTASVQIDITNVTPEGLRSKDGVRVNVVIDALGDEATPFLLKKND
ncbi:hypothetical protein [Pseudobdellovibrio exovorus]|uniref:Lipocalin-like domain-containing protein n=1 Tax=Pseudobdellovibrio exovorus JSS TaxID=1184267 RepID=M4VA69_9BACT|nr:hypothetical protein [Pseudobdellovibrio exovorus]AGH96302.1 hypothetical protein A11Q_2086 [Pseudobdellovibrio exovorus JSS]